jgi:general secretion pathway protein C
MKLFGKQFWIIRLLGIAAAAGMAGSAASSAAALVLIDGASAAFDAAATEGDDEDDETDDEALPTKLGAGTPAATSGSAARRSKSAAAATLDRYNPFCPTCVDAPATTGAVVLAQGPATGPAVATRLPLRLHATMEAERAADSLATIYDTERTIVGVFAVGEMVRPGATLASVGGGHVVLRTAAGDERLDLGMPEPAAAPAPKPDAKPKTKAIAEAKDDGLDAISCATADVCTVERAFVDEILANPAKFASSAPRVGPAPGGGFKVLSVRKGSLGAKLGLKTGDVLVSVNGAEIQGFDDALALMTKLRRASNLEVLLERKGATVRKAIEIR